MKCRLWLLVLGVAALLTVPLRAATPRDELLRLVPDDVGFCLVVQDLRTHAESFLASPFFEQFMKSPVGVALKESGELRKLATFDRELRKHIELSAAQVRDDLLGDAVVLAYRPPPSDKPEEEEGLLLIRARNANLLSKVIERINAVQKLSGELRELETRKHQGLSYTCRIERGATHYYYLHGPVFAFSGQETILKRMLERVADETRTTKLPAQLGRLGVDEALGTLWINPRAFDAELAAKAGQAKGAEAYTLKKLQDYWKAMDGIALSATLGRSDVEFALAISARDGELPESARKFFAAEEKPSDLWSRFPDNALLAFAAKLDVAATVELFADFFPEGTRKELRDSINRTVGAALGLDLVNDVVPNLGPDWGVCLLPVDKSGMPALLAALRVRPGDKAKPVDRALQDGLNTAAVMAIFAHNKANADPLSLKTMTQDKVEVKYLGSERGQAAGLQPAFALKDGYLVLASVPEAVGRFQLVERELPKGGDIPLLRVSIKEIRRFAKDRLDDLSSHVAEKHELSKDEARQRLEKVLATAELFDRLDLSRRTAPGRVTIALQLRTAAALRK